MFSRIILTLILVTLSSRAETVLSTYCGQIESGFSGDGGSAILASFSAPTQVVFDAAGNGYVADSRNHRVRKIDAVTGAVTTFAGNGQFANSGDGGLAKDASIAFPGGVCVFGSDLFISSSTIPGALRKVSLTTNLISTALADLASPRRISSTPQGFVLIAESGKNRILKFNPQDATVATVAGNGTLGSSGDGGPAISAALADPFAAIADAQGNVYITDSGECRIRKVDLSGTISTICGSGIPGFEGDGGNPLEARLFSPIALALSSTGLLYIADIRSNSVRALNLTTNQLSTVSGIGIALDSGDNSNAALSPLNAPLALSLDANDSLYISEGNRVRKIINGTASGNSLDSDGDGISDEFETQVGTLPTDPNSHPPAAGGIFSYIVTNLDTKLNFSKPGTDQIAVKGSALVRSNAPLRDQNIIISVADRSIGFFLPASKTRDSRQKGKSFSVRYKSSDIDGLSNVTFAMKAKGDYQKKFEQIGITPTTESFGNAFFDVVLLIDSFAYLATFELPYVRASNGKSGRIKSSNREGIEDKSGLPTRAR